ncbi:hypothetical protein GCM10009527_071850 [Actinomadura nitritigenes]|uniref:Uncharacterized protein n=1 Tax=Actinomadura nitritigenes TaxID=134602 RepID=A0ABS3R5B0_9ACTN|nr:hypothetical protein [Actinomadura nitritigenes]MBO2441346.1 hypothetical protein [Actinomadura nitritigenes]
MFERPGQVHATGRPGRPLLGVAFLFVAAIVALIPAGRLTALTAEETSGRTAHVLSGIAAWLGAAMRGTGVLACVLKKGRDIRLP